MFNIACYISIGNEGQKIVSYPRLYHDILRHFLQLETSLMKIKIGNHLDLILCIQMYCVTNFNF